VTTTQVPMQQRIREVAERLNTADPYEVARAVADETPEDELYLAYAAALVSTVREVFRDDRNRALSAAAGDADTSGTERYGSSLSRS